MSGLTMWVLVAAGVGVVALAGVLWLRWVRREVGSTGDRAFLLLDRRRGGPPRIAGAEPDAPGETWGGASAKRAARAGAANPLVGGGGRPYAATAASAEVPAVPVAGGVHALLVGGGAPAAPALPTDATLQFLPGRLLLPPGASRAGRELRFVRQPGAVTEVTLGRQSGPADRHVQLLAPTVSRVHARLRWEAGRWSVADLSRTNPVRVNGRAVAGTQVLRDRDRVGVGELELVFRER